MKIFTQSAADFLDEWFESEQAQSHARHRRRDRRQRRPALARHRLHPAASLHGRRRRPSRIVGLRARRHGRGLERHRRFGAQPAAPSSAPTRRSRRSWCATAARAAWCWRTAKRSRRAIVASQSRSQAARSCDCWMRSDLPRRFRRRHPQVSASKARRCKMNLALSGLPEFTALPGRARPAAQRHDAHLPVDRIRRARLGRRQVRPAVASAR